MANHAANAAIMQRAFDAFNAGDIEVFGEIWAPDIVWHQPPGDGPLAGDYQGLQATLEMFGRTVELTAGTFHPTARAVMGGSGSAGAIMDITSERNGHSLSTTSILTATVEDGRMTEVWHVNENPETFDAFFS